MNSSPTLQETARALVAPGKGILAADESSGNIQKKLASLGIESTESNRRDYRQLLFTTPGINQWISGVILYDETVRQASVDGKPLVQLLADKGIIPGIKVDKGPKPLPNFPGETLTEGLDGLRDRLSEYKSLGARFTKWRAVIHITNETASQIVIEANMHALAQYAILSQEAGLVPIVEPEVLMDGTHSIDASETVARRTLATLFNALREYKADLLGLLLKPNMVIPGLARTEPVDATEVAQRTVTVFKDTVPAEVPGIVFLSGGQSGKVASHHLSVMVATNPDLPWTLSFSYGRGLQGEALETWRGEARNIPAAQEAFAKRAALVSKAALGQYNPSMEE